MHPEVSALDAMFANDDATDVVAFLATCTV